MERPSSHVQINWEIMRTVDDLREMVIKHEKRQVLVDSFDEEIDRLSVQVAGLSSSALTKEGVADIVFACVQGYDHSQTESDQQRGIDTRKALTLRTPYFGD